MYKNPFDYVFKLHSATNSSYDISQTNPLKSYQSSSFPPKCWAQIPTSLPYILPFSP